MQVFLTGATGFIGRPLAAALQRRGCRLTALVRRPDSLPGRALASAGVRVVAGDVADEAAVRVGMQGSDIVVHNAGYYEYGVGGRARARMTTVNVRGTEVVLAAARAAGVSRAVHVSSIMAFGDTRGHRPRDETFTRQVEPSTHYEHTKTEAHAIAVRHQNEGAPVVIGCPGAVVGPNDHSFFGYLLRLYLARRLAPTGWGGDSRLSMVHVDDVAEGIALAATRPDAQGTYLLTADARTVREHLATWWTYPGGARIRVWLPWPIMWAANGLLEPLQRAVGLPAFLSREIVMTSRLDLDFTSGRARRELGWQPRSPEQMWGDTIEGELALLRSHPRRGLVERLRPVDDHGPPPFGF